MKVIISEYGLFAVSSIICIAVLAVIFDLFINEDGAFVIAYDDYKMYKTNDKGQVADSDEILGISDVLKTVYAPRFNTSIDEEDKIIKLPLAYDSEDNFIKSYSKEQLVELFIGSYSEFTVEVYDKEGNLITQKDKAELLSLLNGSTVDGKSDFDIVIHKYIPKMTVDNGKKVVSIIETNAVDKYGNVVKDETGNVLKRIVVENEEPEIYSNKDTESSNVKSLDSFYIDFSKPCKFKVVYRYTYETLKAEYTMVFLNETVPQSQQIQIEEIINSTEETTDGE